MEENCVFPMDDLDQTLDQFRLRASIQGRACCVLIDNGYDNLASTYLVHKLGLPISSHPNPYMLQWPDDCGEVLVDKQVIVSFSIGRYKDEVICDVVPMQTSHFLLGQPWLVERKGIFVKRNHGETNRCKIERNGRVLFLTCLEPIHICNDVKLMQQKYAEFEKKLKEKAYVSNNLCGVKSEATLHENSEHANLRESGKNTHENIEHANLRKSGEKKKDAVSIVSEEKVKHKKSAENLREESKEKIGEDVLIENSNLNNSCSSICAPILQEFPTDPIKDSIETSGFVEWKEKQKAEYSLFSTSSVLVEENQLVCLGEVDIYKDPFMIFDSLNPYKKMEVFPSCVCPSFQIVTHVANMTSIIAELEVKHKELAQLESSALLGLEDMHMDWKKRKRVQLIHDESNESNLEFKDDAHDSRMSSKFLLEEIEHDPIILTNIERDSRTNLFKERENDAVQGAYGTSVDSSAFACLERERPPAWPSFSITFLKEMARRMFATSRWTSK